MNINEILSESLFFGMILSLLAYKIGFEIQKKYKNFNIILHALTST